MPSSNYFLKVVKDDEAPVWPVPEDELKIGSQDIGDGYTQYWAYPKSELIDPSQKPEAENLAVSYLSSKPAILIDQSSDLLDLILVNDGHAWAKTESSLANLEDNLSSILEFASNQFNIKVEHFMTTQKVSKEAEEKLDKIERGDSDKSESAEDLETKGNEGSLPSDSADTQTTGTLASRSEPKNDTLEADSFKNLTSSDPKSIFREDSGFEITAKKRSLPKTLFILALLIALLTGGFFFKDRLLSLLKSKPAENKAAEIIISTPSPTPSPTPAFDRSKYSLRVLNGTAKTGQAASLADKLKGLGWKIDSVGNATNSATPQTYIRAKENLPELVQTLIKDLSPDLVASQSSNIKTSDKADAEVVIGKK